MPSKSQTVLKAAAGADTHRKITVKELLCRNFRRGDFGCPEGIRGNTEQKAGTPVWNKKEKMIFVRFLL